LRVRCLACLSLAASLAHSAGCAGGREVTPEALDRARRLWLQAGIRDYDLDWAVRGPNNPHYLATGRDGEVRRVQSIDPGGLKNELHPADTRYYNVDGLFRTIADELALAKSDRPFGQPPGTRVVMQFTSDPKLGYPRSYHRDVLGTPLSIAIE